MLPNRIYLTPTRFEKTAATPQNRVFFEKFVLVQLVKFLAFGMGAEASYRVHKSPPLDRILSQMSPICPAPPSTHTALLVPVCVSGWLVNDSCAGWQLSLRSILEAKRYLCFGRHCRITLCRWEVFKFKACWEKFWIHVIPVRLWHIRTDPLKGYLWNW